MHTRHSAARARNWNRDIPGIPNSGIVEREEWFLESLKLSKNLLDFLLLFRVLRPCCSAAERRQSKFREPSAPSTSMNNTDFLLQIACTCTLAQIRVEIPEIRKSEAKKAATPQTIFNFFRSPNQNVVNNY
jgi:hypothetical protein